MNEVKLLNIGGIDQNVKDQYARDIIAPSENGLDSSSNLPVSSRHYDAGEYLIGQNRLYYEAITDIEIGDTLVVGTNVRATTLSDEITTLKNKSADKVIECIAPMETAAVSSDDYVAGNYIYWSYGLNAGLYEATTTIAEGDAFVVDTNIKESEKIMKQISTLNSEVVDFFNILGPKNLCEITMSPYRVMPGGTELTVSDGVITANGTASITSSVILNTRTLLKANTDYIFTGIDDGTSTTYFFQIYPLKPTGSEIRAYQKTYLRFPVDTEIGVHFAVYEGCTLSNKKFYPMIRLASIEDETFVPYSMTTRELTKAAYGENLLDNPWFTVNQRGKSSYVYDGTGSYFSVDRWGLAVASGTTATVEIKPNGITFKGSAAANNLYQRIEPSRFTPGETYTASLMYQDHLILSGSFIAPYTLPTDITNIFGNSNIRCNMRFQEDFVIFSLAIMTANVNNNIRALKIECGSRSTLAHDLAPIYTHELAKCRASAIVPEDTFANQGEINVGTPNRNLLDNPWFTVNQRGKSSYTTGYCVDRWKNVSNNTITVNSDGSLTIPSVSGVTVFLYQPLEPDLVKRLEGKTVTFSILFDNVIYSASETLPTSHSGTWDTDGVSIDIGSERFIVDLYGGANTSGIRIFAQTSTTSSHTIKAVKLELGSVSTLANDVAPNYAEELVKCQRYFYSINPLEESYKHVGTSYYTSNNLYVNVPIPVPMRAKPSSVSMSGNLVVSSYNGSLVNVATYTPSVDLATPTSIRVKLGSLSTTPAAGFNMVDGNATPKLELSADL